jgi:uncharacterized membrane protein YedE/YeeE
MSAPFYKYDLFGFETGLLIAFGIGVLFGFTLERAGFSSSRKLAMQFYFRDLTVMKVMFTAIVTAMVGLLYLNLADILDLSLLYLNPTYLWPQMLGGVIMGVGFVVGGYCPGTSLVAGAIGKIDAYVYLAGALAGMFVFAETHPLFAAFTESGAMGSVTLSDWLGLRPGVVAFLVILMALGMFAGGEWLEKKFSGHQEAVPIAEQKNRVAALSETTV